MRKTEIKINKNYWAIVRLTNIKYSIEENEDGSFDTDQKSKIYLVEFDTKKELSDWLSDMSVKDGESEGTFNFNVLLMSISWKELNSELQE